MVHYKNLSLLNVEGEIWADIIDFNGLYQVSDMGRVKSIRKVRGKDRQIILKQYLDGKKKYLFVTLYMGKIKTQINVHRLVGIRFISNPENKPEINHKKGIKIDNRASQLEWNTVSENRLHAYRIGLIDKNKIKSMLGNFGVLHHNHKKVLQFDFNDNLLNVFNGTREAMRETGVNQSNISKACSGKCPHSGGFKWQYKH